METLLLVIPQTTIIKVIYVILSASDTVKILKMKISEDYWIPTYQQRIFFYEKELTDDIIINDLVKKDKISSVLRTYVSNDIISLILKFIGHEPLRIGFF